MSTQPIKVLMFGWEFPPFNSGGLGTACLGLTEALSSENVSVTFVLPKKVDVSSPFLHIQFADEFLPGVSFTIINSLLKPYLDPAEYERLRKGQPSIYGLNLLEEVKLYALRARELASSLDFDVIHAHDWLSFGAGVAAKQVSHKPLVVHVHATEFDRTGGGGVNPEVYEMERYGLREADTIITVSNLTKRMVVDRYGVMPSKVEVVHNGITEIASNKELDDHVKRLQALKSGGKKVVLFVGRLTLQKGPDYFLRAAKRVLEYYPEVCFVIAGSGDMQGQVMQEAAWLGISDRIIFAGFVRGNELGALYRVADLFVMPSVSEPFGITTLEAITNGTPVILSKQSGVAEVVNHAIKVDFWDIDAMANAIVGVLYNASLRNTMRKNARQELSLVTWHHAARRCINIYKRMMGG